MNIQVRSQTKCCEMYNKKISYIFYRMGVLNLLHEILHSFGASHDQEGKRLDFFIIFIIFILLIKSHILSLEKNQSYKQLTYLFIFFSVRFMTWINSDKAMNGSYVHNILKHWLTIEMCRNISIIISWIYSYSFLTFI